MFTKAELGLGGAANGWLFGVLALVAAVTQAVGSSGRLAGRLDEPARDRARPGDPRDRCRDLAARDLAVAILIAPVVAMAIGCAIMAPSLSAWVSRRAPAERQGELLGLDVVGERVRARRRPGHRRPAVRPRRATATPFQSRPCWSISRRRAHRARDEAPVTVVAVVVALALAMIGIERVWPARRWPKCAIVVAARARDQRRADRAGVHRRCDVGALAARPRVRCRARLRARLSRSRSATRSRAVDVLRRTARATGSRRCGGGCTSSTTARARIEILTAFYKHPLEIVGESIRAPRCCSTSVLGVSPEAAFVITTTSGVLGLFYHWNVATPRLAGLPRAAAREPLHPPRARRPRLQLLGAADPRHRVRHVPQPATVRRPVRARR